MGWSWPTFPDGKPRPFAFIPLDGKTECLEMLDLNFGLQTHSLLFTLLLGWFCRLTGMPTQLGNSPGARCWQRKD